MILSTTSFVPPAVWATLPGLAAALAYLAVAARPALRAGVMSAAWALHGLAVLALLTGLAEGGGGVRFGFAIVLSLTAWLVLAVYAIESRFMALDGSQRGLAALGLLSVSLVLVFPADARPLAGSPWAPLHWILGIASYALFGAAVLHAALLDRSERALRRRRADVATPAVPLLQLEALTFRFVAAGFVVLSLALLLGVWFASPWRWDHKAVFSLLGWFVLGGLLAGRQAFGWRGRRATRWLYVGTLLLLLAYVGSRFVLEVLLHRAPAGMGA